MTRLEAIKADYKNFTINRTHTPPLVYAMRFANDIRSLLRVADAAKNFHAKNKWASTLNVECEESWSMLCEALNYIDEELELGENA